MTSEFYAAISGAIVGGIITVCMQLFTINAARKERDDERLENRKTLSECLLMKVMRIYSYELKLNKLLEAAYDSADPANHNDPWRFVMPVATDFEFIKFTFDELALVRSLNDNDLFHLIIQLDHKYNDLIRLFSLYRTKRTALTDQMSAEMEGNIGTSILSTDEVNQFKPRMVELNSIISPVRKHLKKDLKESRFTLESLHETLKKSKLTDGNIMF